MLRYLESAGLVVPGRTPKGYRSYGPREVNQLRSLRELRRRFGVDLGHVRIMTGNFAEEFTKQRSAYAVTVGGTGMILMGGSGDKGMHTRAGQALLAHELTHVAQQRDVYARRRGVLKPAVEAAGFRVDHSEGGLYLWATAGEDAWDSLARLADLGILAGPGHFYGEHFPNHVRFSLTATDERIAEAARRLASL